MELRPKAVFVVANVIQSLCRPVPLTTEFYVFEMIDYWKEKICYCHRFLPCGKRSLTIEFFTSLERIKYKTVYNRCCTFLPFRGPPTSSRSGRFGSCAAGDNADLRRFTRQMLFRFLHRTTRARCKAFAGLLLLKSAKRFLLTCCWGGADATRSYMLLNYYYFCY